MNFEGGSISSNAGLFRNEESSRKEIQTGYRKFFFVTVPEKQK